MKKRRYARLAEDLTEVFGSKFIIESDKKSIKITHKKSKRSISPSPKSKDHNEALAEFVWWVESILAKLQTIYGTCGWSSQNTNNLLFALDFNYCRLQYCERRIDELISRKRELEEMLVVADEKIKKYNV